MKISQNNNFIYLFIALVSLLFFTSLSSQIDALHSSDTIQLVLVSVLLLGVHSLKADHSWMWAVYFMVFVLSILFVGKKVLSDPFLLDIFHLLTLLVFFAGSFRQSYRQIFTSSVIDRNMLMGSVVLFLLIGLIWSVLYLLLLSIFPEGFNGFHPTSWQEDFSKVTYFSFVTLTTLGYGDISPKSPITEFFVYSEAIAGIFYMAIIVSSLVSARLNTSSKDSQ
jgi:hypothetical protein